MEQKLNDAGCWRLLQGIVQRAFEQADTEKEADKVYNWAIKAKEGNNMIFHCYSEIGEHDYDKLVNLLVERCEKTMKFTSSDNKRISFEDALKKLEIK